MEILSRHRLTVLNSWGRKAATYKRPSTQTGGASKPSRFEPGWQLGERLDTRQSMLVCARSGLQKPQAKETRPKGHVPERELQIQNGIV